MKATESYFWRLGSFTKARCTENPVLMLRDALPAEKTAALRAAGHRLTQHMIETASIDYIRHHFSDETTGWRSVMVCLAVDFIFVSDDQDLTFPGFVR
jgi:hypothetical protein